jgi:hypothetical protein
LSDFFSKDLNERGEVDGTSFWIEFVNKIVIDDMDGFLLKLWVGRWDLLVLFWSWGCCGEWILL